MRILVTGAAGFVGFHTAQALVARGDEVVGIDNLNAYYDPTLKEARLARLRALPRFTFERTDLADHAAMAALFERVRPQRVVHLAAQAGVRYSIEQPFAYADSNLTGFLTVLEGCRGTGVEHLVYASSSSVYGANARVPFAVTDRVDHPISLYAATKKANELMAHTYAHLYRLPVTGLRFFTVYGPFGRPDMAYFKFTRALLAGEEIDVYNGGHHARDFTYIDDIITGVVGSLDAVPAPVDGWTVEAGDPSRSSAPYRLHNIGNTQPSGLMDLIASIERATGCKARMRMLPMQPGDVERTWADVSSLTGATGFTPSTSLDEGIARFVAWYREFYGV